MLQYEPEDPGGVNCDYLGSFYSTICVAGLYFEQHNINITILSQKVRPEYLWTLTFLR